MYKQFALVIWLQGLKITFTIYHSFMLYGCHAYILYVLSVLYLFFVHIMSMNGAIAHNNGMEGEIVGSRTTRSVCDQ